MTDTSFLSLWSKAAITTIGLFWMAFWAFALGYLLSSAIQVFVTRARMRQHMGEAGASSVLYASLAGVALRFLEIEAQGFAFEDEAH